MRKFTLFLGVFLTTILSVFAQDRIILHSGKTIPCKILEVSETIIKYKLPGEDVINTISKNTFKSIKLASGRIIEGSTAIWVLGEEFYPLVVFTSDPDAVAGLTRVNFEMMGTGDNWSPMWGYMKGDGSEEAKMNLKRIAAASNCHIILITDKIHSSSSRDKESQYTGYGYRYDFVDDDYIEQNEITKWKEFVKKGIMPYEESGYIMYRKIKERIYSTENSITVTSEEECMNSLNKLERLVKGYKYAAYSCPNKDKDAYVKASRKLDNMYVKLKIDIEKQFQNNHVN